MRNSAGSGVAVLFMMAVVLAGIWGYFANAVAIINTTALPLTGLFVLRCLGIVVPPLGAIVGFI